MIKYLSSIYYDSHQPCSMLIVSPLASCFTKTTSISLKVVFMKPGEIIFKGSTKFRFRIYSCTSLQPHSSKKSSTYYSAKILPRWHQSKEHHTALLHVDCFLSKPSISY